jgi:hypothetical protein
VSENLPAASGTQLALAQNLAGLGFQEFNSDRVPQDFRGI